jgi:hypothetical protein
VCVASSTNPLLLPSNPLGASEGGDETERRPNNKQRETPASSFMGTSRAAGVMGNLLLWLQKAK